MTLDELITPERVLPAVRAADKAALLGLLAGQICGGLGLDESEVTQALAAREALGSTGVGNGIALPHAGLAGLARPVALLARLERPLAFEAVDGRAVDLVALLLSPAEGSEHLHALAALSRRLREPGVATALRAAADGAEMWRILVGETNPA